MNAPEAFNGCRAGKSEAVRSQRRLARAPASERKYDLAGRPQLGPGSFFPCQIAFPAEDRSTVQRG
jgi:hypothetical protein